MALMLRIRFHGRGGQGAKTASRILGNSAFAEGLNVQDSPLYGAERRGAPVTAFTRISDAAVMERGYIFDPDIVIVLDETLLNDPIANPLQGIRTGGILFVNSGQPADKIAVDGRNIHVTTLDATSLALSYLGRTVISAASAAAAARLTSKISQEALQSGVESELSELGISKETISKNVELARTIYDSVLPSPINTKENLSTESLVPLEVVVSNPGSEDILSAGNSFARRTGDWRIFKPTIDYEKCTGCMICYVYCPESAVKIGSDKKPVIDYDNCKGCMICYRECPLKAITSEREVKVS
jgi:pyruvate ferredoxin oxidoreductase gamma subunit